MTGYLSKRAMARDKLEEDAFDAWWDTRPRLNKTNPAMPDSFEYWAWEGWHAALAQPEQEPVGGTREAFEKWAKTFPNYIDITRFENGYSDSDTNYAWVAWQAALAQPALEPVAWGVDWGKAGDIPCVSIIKRLPNGGIEVMAVEYAPYTTPPQRPWVGLTEEDFSAINQSCFTKLQAATSAESILKEKNNGT